MTIKQKSILLTIIIALIAFPMGQVVWEHSNVITPSPRQVPFFIFLTLIEVIALGAGVALVVFGRQWLKKAPSMYKTESRAIFYSLTWMLISWWPHDNFHASNGVNVTGLIIIEYAFHLTLIGATFVLLFSLLSLMRSFGTSR